MSRGVRASSKRLSRRCDRDRFEGPKTPNQATCPEGQCMVRRRIKTFSQWQGTIYEKAIPNSDSRCLPGLFKAKRDQLEDPMWQHASLLRLLLC